MSYDDWKTHNRAEDRPEEPERPRGHCPNCGCDFDEYDATLEPYCSARCRIEGEQREPTKE